MSDRKYFDETINRLQRLVNDLKDLRDGKQPSPSILDQAPLFNNWSETSRPVPCLEGAFLGHPLIPDGHYGITSQIYYIDPDYKYIRTLSRYYRLGKHACDNYKDILQ